MKLREICFLALSATSHALSAQTCQPPHPVDRLSGLGGHAEFSPGGGDACDLIATLNAGNSSAAGAFGWYSLPVAASTWRISFRMDTSQFGSLSPFVDSLSILAATSKVPIGGESTLLRASLFAIDDSGPILALYAACNTAPGYLCGTVIQQNIVNDDLLRFEVDIGSGSAGQARVWINADFTDPPTATFGNLDNAAWLGVQYAALGAFEPYGTFAANGTALRFYDVTSPYDTLFWSDFDE